MNPFCLSNWRERLHAFDDMEYQLKCADVRLAEVVDGSLHSGDEIGDPLFGLDSCDSRLGPRG